MTAGLPGVGIGGIFFLLSAFVMPVMEVGRTLGGRSSIARWRVVVRQFALAVGIVAAFSGGMWLVSGTIRWIAAGSGEARRAARFVADPFPVSPVLISALVLAAVLVGAAVLRRVAERSA